MATSLDVDDRYELGPVIGRGGMGQVHRARDHRVGREVAFKLMHAELADRDDARHRFRDEAVAAARLHHPHAVTVFDAGEHDGRPFVVMELLPGRTVADELASGPVAEARVRRWTLEVLDALGAAHERGIVHRDVKPGNLLLTDDDHVKVADFGIALIAQGSDLTRTGEIVGSAAYLAPERLAGGPGSEASDLYAVGVVMYETLTGRKPFAGASPIELAHAIHSTDAPRVDAVRRDLDPALVAVVERAMRKNPAERFASAASMASALRDQSPTVPIRPRERAPHAEETRVFDLTRGAPRRATGSVATSTRRAPRMVAAIVAIAALGVGVGAFAASRSPDGNESPPTTQVPDAPPVTLPAPVEDALRGLEDAVTP